MLALQHLEALKGQKGFLINQKISDSERKIRRLDEEINELERIISFDPSK